MTPAPVATTPFWARVLATRAPRATVLIRLAVGVVFATEGLQKFLHPDVLGAGRFAKIGLPAPELLGPFVGAVELAGGSLVLAGLLTRVASLPLLIDMLVALASTKVPVLLGRGYGGFAPPAVPRHGFWSMMHEARTDLAMLLGAAFLLAVGAGAWSCDARLVERIGAAKGRRGGGA
ncbi:MAG TPA: DoxX family protein [Polyangiaceae bacterium]|nr:DoxX family protein [Polyangiaceae bacterium]